MSNLQIPTEIIRNNFKHTHGTTDHLEPKIYCTITYQESTRSALSAVAKSSAASAASTDKDKNDDAGSPERASMAGPPGSNAHLQEVRTHEFPRGQMLGLDLVYRNGRMLVQGVVCDGPCGTLVYEGKIRIGDTVVAANNKSIVNLHRDASFAVIEKAIHWGEGVGTQTQEQASGATFTLSFLYQPTTPQRMTFSDTSRPPARKLRTKKRVFGSTMLSGIGGLSSLKPRVQNLRQVLATSRCSYVCTCVTRHRIMVCQHRKSQVSCRSCISLATTL